MSSRSVDYRPHNDVAHEAGECLMVPWSQIPAVTGRLAVLTPTVHDAGLSVARALSMQMLETPLQAGVPHFRFDYKVDVNREALADTALSEGADWVLWWDDDILVAPDALVRLFAHRYPICSGLYVDRQDRMAAAYLAEWQGKTLAARMEELPAGHCAYLDGVGLGFCLMDARVLRRLPRPWFEYTPEVGEDFGFFLSVQRHLGIEVLVDGAVRCRHERVTAVDPDRDHQDPQVAVRV